MIRIGNIFSWMALSTILFAGMTFAYPSSGYTAGFGTFTSPINTSFISPINTLGFNDYTLNNSLDNSKLINPLGLSPLYDLQLSNPFDNLKLGNPLDGLNLGKSLDDLKLSNPLYDLTLNTPLDVPLGNPLDGLNLSNPIDTLKFNNNTLFDKFGASGTIKKSSKNSTDINKSVNNNISLLLDDIGSKLDNAAVQSAPSAEQILSTFDTSIANGTLTGKGPGKSADRRRETFRKMIETTNDKIAAGKNKNAYMQLRRAYKKIDGDSGDFVEGEAAAELAQMILDLEYSLEQTTSLAKLRNRIEAAGDKITAGNMKGAYNQLRQAYKETDGDSYEFVDEGAAAELAQIILDLENSLGQTTSLALSTSGTSQNPLPPTVWLLGSGLLGLLGWRRFRKS